MAVNKRLLQGAAAAGGLVPSENFKVVLYTGNGSARSITGVGFQPDFVWIKGRTNTASNQLFDSTRGATYTIGSDLTLAETQNTQMLTSFNTDGFSLGNHGSVNGSGVDYVAWCWKANGGTTSSNTDGSATSTVQVNTAAGFSIAKMTFAGAGSIGHGLGVVPDLVFLKSLSAAEDWQVYHTANGTGKYLKLNTSDAVATRADSFSTVNSTIVTNSWTGASVDWIMYSFVSVAGFSKFGSYTGNGSADGPIVETGFEPAFLMIKNASSTESGGASWLIYDNKRSPSNPRDRRLYANADYAELQNSLYDIDFLSNGFKIQSYSSNYGHNNNGDTYIYMAFAADPDTEAPTLADSFAVKTYTGNGSTQTISGLGFKPSFLWTKQIDGTFSHIIHDTLNQPHLLITNSTGALITNGSNTATFTDDGFSLEGGANHTSINNSGSNFVAWAWKADDNEPTINTEGSVDSIVSANANAGFSIVKWKGSGSAGTLGHGLSAAPELIITKNLDTSNDWWTYNKDLNGGTNPASYFIRLNTTNAETSNPSGSLFQGTSPTSTVFSIGTSLALNNFIAYCFHSVAGYSKFGSYSGNNTGQTITTGFQPDFLMLKKTNVTSEWWIMDSVRGTTNNLEANTSDAQNTGISGAPTFVSTGFNFSGSTFNETGTDWIYMAIKMNLSPVVDTGEMAYLVVAGGAGGASNGGGGGAGGLRTSFGTTSGGGAAAESNISLSNGTYTITIGAGGASLSNTTDYQSRGNAGSSSTITGNASVSTTGGGAPGSNNLTPLSGGCGGGAGAHPAISVTGGAGTTGEGFAGGSSVITGHPYRGGGGGGTGQAGFSNSAGSDTSNGGDGLSLNITGASVNYGGGGGGTGGTGSGYTGPGGTGGAGGGGNGGAYNGSGTAGVVNTGSGGGATGDAGSHTSGAGGSGVVILRMRTSDYSGSTTGSPTVTTYGSETILTYTGSGTYVHS